VIFSFRSASQPMVAKKAITAEAAAQKATAPANSSGFLQTMTPITASHSRAIPMPKNLRPQPRALQGGF
jgi:hypothetical protein